MDFGIVHREGGRDRLHHPCGEPRIQPLLGDRQPDDPIQLLGRAGPGRPADPPHAARHRGERAGLEARAGRRPTASPPSIAWHRAAAIIGLGTGHTGMRMLGQKPMRLQPVPRRLRRSRPLPAVGLLEGGEGPLRDLPPTTDYAGEAGARSENATLAQATSLHAHTLPFRGVAAASVRTSAARPSARVTSRRTPRASPPRAPATGGRAALSRRCPRPSPGPSGDGYTRP